MKMTPITEIRLRQLAGGWLYELWKRKTENANSPSSYVGSDERIYPNAKAAFESALGHIEEIESQEQKT